MYDFFFGHNPSTKMTRFKPLVKNCSVYSLKTFPTGTKGAYRQKKKHTHTQKRPKKAKNQSKMNSGILFIDTLNNVWQLVNSISSPLVSFVHGKSLV